MIKDHLPYKPRLHSSYHVIAVPESGEILLSSEGRTLQLQPVDGVDSPNLLKGLISLIDGEHTVDDIVGTLSDFGEAQVVDSLQRLHQARLLEDAAPPTALLPKDQQELYASQVTFFSHLTNEPYKVQAALAQSQVAVLGLGALGQLLLSSLADSGVGALVGIDVVEESAVAAEAVHDQLKRQFKAQQKLGVKYEGIILSRPEREKISQALQGAHLLIAALDTPNPDLMDRVNEVCIQSQLTWMPVGIQAWEGFIGPTVLPRQTACYKCYELRVKANLTYYEQHLLYEERLRTVPDSRTFGELQQFKRLTADMAAIEAIKVLTYVHSPATVGCALNLNFLTLKVPKKVRNL